MTNEEKEIIEKDILFQIDMELYDKFNDKFCEINDNLGDIYSYRDLEELKQAEKNEEIRLLRKAIKELESDKKIKDKMIDLMAEHLTTPIHSKKDVVEYFENLAKESGEIDEDIRIICWNRSLQHSIKKNGNGFRNSGCC